MIIFEEKQRVRIAKCLDGWDSQHLGKKGVVFYQTGEWVDVHIDGDPDDEYYCFEITELEKL